MRLNNVIILRLLIVTLGLISILSGAGCSQKDEQNIFASGTVEAVEVNVSAETGGKITEILAQEGDSVKDGDVLGRIDSTVQVLQVQQAEAALRAAQEKAKETKSGSRDQVIAQSRSTVQQITSLQTGAREAMGNAQENLERIQGLFTEGGATSQQLSDAKTKFELSKAQYDAYTAQKNSAQQQLDLVVSGATSENINIADAGVAQAQANLAIAQAQLAKTIFRSSIEGVISTVNFNKGEYVSPGAPLTTVLDNDNLWINVYIPEKDLPKIQLGRKAEIYIDAYQDKAFAGEVSFISSKAEFTPKNLQTKEERVNMVFAVKVKINEGKELLKPGLPADVTIIAQ